MSTGGAGAAQKPPAGHSRGEVCEEGCSNEEVCGGGGLLSQIPDSPSYATQIPRSVAWHCMRLVTSYRRLTCAFSPALARSLAFPPPLPSCRCPPFSTSNCPPLRTERNQAAACSSTDPPPLQLFLLLTPASPLPHRFPTASSSVSSPKNTPLNRVAPTKFRLSICFQICPRFLPSRFDQISLLCKAANSCCFGATLISGGPPIPWNRQFGNVSSRYGTT